MMEAVTLEKTYADRLQPNRQHIGTTVIPAIRMHCMPTAFADTDTRVKAFAASATSIARLIFPTSSMPYAVGSVTMLT